MVLKAKLNIEVITSAAFWCEGSGLWARTRELVRFLSSHGAVRVCYIGQLMDLDLQRIKQLDFRVEVWALDLTLCKEPGERLQKCDTAFASSPPAAVYLVIQTENSFVLESLPDAGEKWVDTIDLISDRTRKLKGKPVQEHFPLSVHQEAALLKKYDLAICIQQEEYRSVCSWIGAGITVCVPHPVNVTPRNIRNPPLGIGLVASNWHPNVYGLVDFIKACWPLVRRTGAHLHVYGGVCSAIRADLPAVTFHGFKEDLGECYDNLDIVINPVTYGAGLKIKSLEALANGLPLVTMPEGASGIEEQDGQGLFIASDWDDFAQILVELTQDHARCMEAGRKGMAFIHSAMSPQVCFAPLEQRLQALERAL
jgi:glycosyltransferase involved in cell wall biosynthesis